MIHCIMLAGLSLSESAHNALFDAAIHMAKNKKNKHKLVHDDVTATIRTEFEECLFVTIFGCVFEADVHTGKGGSKVKYLVEMRDLNVKGHELKWLKSPTKKSFNPENN